MIRLSASLSKKVPIHGVDYSSQSFGGSLEIEVSDADQSEVIKAKLKRLYTLLSESVEEQVAAASGQKPPVHAEGNGGNGNSNGNGAKKEAPAAPVRNVAMATDAQRKAVFAICRAQGKNLTTVLGELNVKDAGELTVKQASNLIDRLKKNGTAAAN